MIGSRCPLTRENARGNTCRKATGTHRSGRSEQCKNEINLIDPARIRAILHATFDGAPPPPVPHARASSANEAASTTPQASHLAQSPTEPPAGSAVGGSDVPCVN